MAVKSPLLHYNSISTISTLRFSANESNTAYTIGPDGDKVYAGVPDISYDKFVVIKDVKMYWTHGKSYVFYSLDDMRSSLNSALSDSREYLNRRFNDLATINGQSITKGGNIDLSNIDWNIDSVLDDSSKKPVQNKVVTEAIYGLGDRVDDAYEKIQEAINAVRELVRQGIPNSSKDNVVYMSESQWRTLTRNETLFTGAAFEKLRGCEINIYEDIEDEDIEEVVSSASYDPESGTLIISGTYSEDGTLTIGGSYNPDDGILVIGGGSSSNAHHATYDTENGTLTLRGEYENEVLTIDGEYDESSGELRL